VRTTRDLTDADVREAPVADGGPMRRTTREGAPRRGLVGRARDHLTDVARDEPCAPQSHLGVAAAADLVCDVAARAHTLGVLLRKPAEDAIRAQGSSARPCPQEGQERRILREGRLAHVPRQGQPRDRPRALWPGRARLEAAGKAMWDHEGGAGPVIDHEGKPIAMITDRDVAMASYTQGKPLYALPVSLAMSKKLVACRASEPIATAEALMRSQQIRRLPVVDDDGFVVGILSLSDIAMHGHAKRKHAAFRDELGPEAIATTLSAICARPPAAMAAE